MGRKVFAATFLAIAMQVFGAGSGTNEGAGAPVFVTDPRDRDVMAMPGFMTSHPDMRLRGLALEALSQGRPEQARQYFQRASRYADKLSQAALAEMYWKGDGGSVDKALAYAWMDMAAERGTPWLLAMREQYWAVLDERDRARAIQEGHAIYREYSDEVAKPRLEYVLRVARRNVTGSRVGWVSNMLDIGSPDDGLAGKAVAVSADDYYSDRYWEPEAYWAWQGTLLQAAPRKGTVTVGAPQQDLPE